MLVVTQRVSVYPQTEAAYMYLQITDIYLQLMQQPMHW